jgi:hypothetical protein
MLGQRMEMIDGRVYQNNIPISVSMASNQSIAVSSVAHTYFRKATMIRNWNVFFGIFGSYEAILGTHGALNHPDPTVRQASVLDIAIGSFCIGVIPGRENRRKLYIAQGIKAYNDALKKDD